jgi:hypothetical protein
MPVMGRSADVPLIGYPRTAGLPAISVHRWKHPHDALPVPVSGSHAHDFLVLLYLGRATTSCAWTAGTGC